MGDDGEGHAHMIWGDMEVSSSSDEERDHGRLKNISFELGRERSMRSEIKYLQKHSGEKPNTDHWDVGDVLATAPPKAVQSSSRKKETEGATPFPDTGTGSSCAQNRQLPSVGSAAHTFGTCQPCHYEFTKHGCDKGIHCGFCHFHHGKHAGKHPRTKLSKPSSAGYSCDV